MKRFLISLIPLTLLSPSMTLASFPYLGDGSDNCDFNGSVLTKSLYNCVDLTIQGTVTVDASVTSSITFRVQNNVHIYGELNLNGINGIDGINGTTSSATVVAGKAGGYQTSDGPVANSFGLFGQDASAIAGTCGGSGGGGGAHNPISPATDGIIYSSSSGIVTTYSAPGSRGTQGYGDENYFEFEFYGGSGGGNGSNGDNSGQVAAGGVGGAGGGAVRIISGGVIEIHAGAKISVDGGNGGNGVLDGSTTIGGGGGGGGAGGSIFLQAKNTITNDGTIQSLGGTGGSGATGAGNGGNGAKGRIRFDDYDGVIDGSGSVSPTPITHSIISGASYQGTLNCGSIESQNENHTTLFGSFLLGLLSIIFLFKISLYSRK